jgi:outer membrane protein OmpA-like peptidoglycan-associated protein
MNRCLKLALAAFLVSLLSGCAWMPWSPERLATTSRVAERCTSIGNVIGKNYQVSGKLNLLVGGMGVGWSQTGVVLSPEAAERQIEMDRLCRAWAVGAISDDKWSDIYVKFALASIAPLARANTPEAQERVDEATAQLKSLAGEIAKLRSNSNFNPDNVDAKLNAAVGQLDNSPKTLAEIHDDAAAAASGAILPVASGQKRGADGGNSEAPPGSGPADLRSIAAQMFMQHKVVVTALGDVEKRLLAVEGRPSGPGNAAYPFDRNWQTKGAAKVYFALGKSDLSDKSKRALDDIVRGPFPRDLRVEVMGYADATGSVQNNARLSIARAEEVRDYLIFERHLPASFVVTLGRQQGVSFFGAPADNRVVTVKVYEEGAKPESAALAKTEQSVTAAPAR